MAPVIGHVQIHDSVSIDRRRPRDGAISISIASCGLSFVLIKQGYDLSFRNLQHIQSQKNRFDEYNTS